MGIVRLPGESRDPVSLYLTCSLRNNHVPCDVDGLVRTVVWDATFFIKSGAKNRPCPKLPGSTWEMMCRFECPNTRPFRKRLLRTR